MQEDPHCVHTDVFRPAEFLIDLRRVETLCLPHFEFVDRVFRNIVAPNQPALLLVPRVSFFITPAALRENGTRNANHNPGREKHHPIR